MEQNHYFASIYKRPNYIKIFLKFWIIVLSFFFKPLIEVFIRRDFGRRYFSFGLSWVIAFVLLIIPSVINASTDMYYMGKDDSFLYRYLTWYLFLVVFIITSYLRYREIKQDPSIVDFDKFSYYSGESLISFYAHKFFGKSYTIREIEIILEPAIAFLIGVVLSLFNQRLGNLLIISSVFYSVSYYIAYSDGTNYLLDKIDEKILNEELYEVFVNEEEGKNSKGVVYRGDKPPRRESRSGMFSSCFESAKNDFSVAK